MSIKIPREFRLLEELDNSSQITGVSYGLEDPSDNDFINWTGGLMANTGHFIGLTFECLPTYPESAPIIHFDKDLINQSPSNQEDEMKTYLKRVHTMCKREVLKSGDEVITSHLKDDVLSWNESKTIGSYLFELHKKIFS